MSSPDTRATNTLTTIETVDAKDYQSLEREQFGTKLTTTMSNKNVKDQLKKGSLKMYQYLTTSTPRTNSNQPQLISKSPRYHPE
jgi:hypothetical protein